MTRSRLSACFLAGLVLVSSAAAAVAAVTPTRTSQAPARVTALAASGASVAYAVATARGDCSHVELWRVDRKKTWRLGRSQPCPAAGFAVAGVSIATTRALWVTRSGAGAREWRKPGAPKLLVDGTPSLPVRGQIDSKGLAWARGSKLFWRSGAVG